MKHRKGDKMAQTMLIADDLTGALDAGVCFVPQGAEVLVDSTAVDVASIDACAGALCVNAATRHMKAHEAADRVFGLVLAARSAGVRRLVKKTDSALRGNVGAELAAAWKASGAPCLHFLPALPAMNRVTEGGIHYIDGLPVSQSVFGHDPFEPVMTSDIREIISSQADVPVECVAEGKTAPTGFEGIIIYDASSVDSMESRVRELLTRDDGAVLAGCAGLASALASVDDSATRPRTPLSFNGNLLVVCGSVNNVSRVQCATAARAGAATYHIAETEKCDNSWLCSDDGLAFVNAVSRDWASCPLTVVDGSGLEDLSELIPADLDVRQVVSDHIGALLAAVCSVGVRGRALVTGGDVLTSFLAQAKVASVTPRGQVSAGVVAFDVRLPSGVLTIASKSGGFGDESLLVDMAQLNTMDKECCSHA